MTLIAYSHGHLLADTLGELKVNRLSNRMYLKKLYISPCKRFAFAASGREIMPSEVSLLMDIFTAALSQFYINEGREGMQINSDHSKVLLDRGFVIMTSDHVFHSIDSSTPFWFDELRTDAWVGSGTYIGGFSIARLVMPVLKAARLTVERVSGRNDVEIHHIAAKDLLSFLQPLPKKRRTK